MPTPVVPMSFLSLNPAVAPRRLLIVDDHPIMRQGLTHVLQLEPDLTVCAQADNATRAVALLETDAFDLALIDLTLQGVSGLDLLKTIRVRWPELPVLVLSMHDELLYAERVLRAGARGYVMKGEDSARLVAAVRRVLDGQLYVSDAVNRRVLDRLLRGTRHPHTDGAGQIIDLLSNRELEVFQLISRGQGTREIATEMHVSVKTIETYRAHIKEKLRLKTAPELMRVALDWTSHHGED